MSGLDPYLWLHLWGVAIVPLALAGCLAALAVGDPLGPPGVELGLLALLGTLPPVWLQGTRPWYPYSLGPLYVRPSRLTLGQGQRLAGIHRAWRAAGSGLLALGMIMVLEGLYRLAPVASGTTPWSAWSRPWAWGVALACFAGANFAAQVGLTGLGLLLGTPRPSAPALTVEAITRRFTILGIPTSSFLPRTVLPPEPGPPSPLEPPPGVAQPLRHAGDDPGRSHPLESGDEVSGDAPPEGGIAPIDSPEFIPASGDLEAETLEAEIPEWPTPELPAPSGAGSGLEATDAPSEGEGAEPQGLGEDDLDAASLIDPQADNLQEDHLTVDAPALARLDPGDAGNLPPTPPPPLGLEAFPPATPEFDNPDLESQTP